MNRGNARVWVAAAPAGAPELGNWVFGVSSSTAQPVPWIRAGNYRFDLREGSLPTGALLGSVSVIGEYETAQNVDASEFVGQSIVTNMMVAQSYPVTLTFRNTGSTVWNATEYKLGAYGQFANNWGISRVPTNTPVVPGDFRTFSFNVIAPSIPGEYDFEWRMLNDQFGTSWFGQSSQSVKINVSAPSAATSCTGTSTTTATVSLAQNSTTVSANGVVNAAAVAFLTSASGISNGWQYVSSNAGGQINLEIPLSSGVFSNSTGLFTTTVYLLPSSGGNWIYCGNTEFTRAQAVLAPKLFGYYGIWNKNTNPIIRRDDIQETLDHSNLVWATPYTDYVGFKEMIGRHSVTKVILDGGDIFYGNPCGVGSEFLSGDSDGRKCMSPHDARLRYRELLSQLDINEYQKIIAIFPIDEPDQNTLVTVASLQLTKQIISEEGIRRFGSRTLPPLLGVTYGYSSVPSNLVGGNLFDWVSFNCYPVSYNNSYPNNLSDECVGETLADRLNQLKAALPGKKYVLFAETALKESNSSSPGRQAAIVNLRGLRNIAMTDASVVAVIGFNYRGLDPALDIAQGQVWFGPPLLGSSSGIDVRSSIIREGKCIIGVGLCD